MAKNYTQDYVVEVLEVSQKTYSNMENGKSQITINTIQKLADLYGKDALDLTKELLGGSIIIQHNTAADGSYVQGINTVNNTINHISSSEIITQLQTSIEELKQRISQL